MTSLLFLMLMFFMLVAHWMACAWYAIGFHETHGQDLSWLSKLTEESNLKAINNTNNLPPLKSRYVTSLYYVMTLCTTVGFGNVSANTDYEKIFTICGMVLGGKYFISILINHVLFLLLCFAFTVFCFAFSLCFVLFCFSYLHSYVTWLYLLRTK